MKKILIAEDDLEIAQIEKDYLEINGMQARIAADGQTGVPGAGDAVPGVVVPSPAASRGLTLARLTDAVRDVVCETVRYHRAPSSGDVILV